MVVDGFNKERSKANKPLVEPFGGPYPFPRSPEWDYIYDLFKVDIRFNASPPLICEGSDRMVTLIPHDTTYQEYINSRTPQNDHDPQIDEPANDFDESLKAKGKKQFTSLISFLFTGNVGTRKRPRMSGSDDIVPLGGSSRAEDVDRSTASGKLYNHP